ncbi:MAG: hypothetical protein GY757_15815, partial [bacterium]|nr:hypothetical protein [bacterium]
VAAVWRFATSVTNNMNLEVEDSNKDENRLYGVERLKHEEVERKFNLTPGGLAAQSRRMTEKRKQAASKKRKQGNASAAVARLVVIAIIIFAMGEPVILSAPADIGRRAMGAVIVFLLAAGIVLAAASALGTYRRMVKGGGKASLNMVPIKITVGVILLTVLMAVSLSLPGIKYTGSGDAVEGTGQASGNISGKESNKSTSESPDGEGDEESASEDGDRHYKDASEESESEYEDSKELRDAYKKKSKPPDSKDSSSSESSRSIFDMFASLGKLLIYPVVLIFIFVIIYALVKLGPALKGKGFGFADRLRDMLNRLRSLFRRGQEGKGRSRRVADPLKLLALIHGLPPREAVLTAYDCFVAFLERAGHVRQERLTPYE